MATYTDWQGGLLRVALEELKAVAGEGLEKDAEGVDGSRSACAAFLTIYCVILSCSSL